MKFIYILVYKSCLQIFHHLNRFSLIFQLTLLSLPIGRSGSWENGIKLLLDPEGSSPGSIIGQSWGNSINDPKLWVAATSQVLISLHISCGLTLTLSSRSKNHGNIFRYILDKNYLIKHTNLKQSTSLNNQPLHYTTILQGRYHNFNCYNIGRTYQCSIGVCLARCCFLFCKSIQPR